MANRFEVQIVALDAFSKTFRNLNNSVSKAVRPLTSVQRQVGALSREMHLDKLAKGMGVVQRASIGMARSMGALTGPMESLFGITAGGGIAAGIASVGAAIGGLSASWGRAGLAASRNARDLGMSTGKLQEYTSAASLAGLSSEQMTGALRALSDKLYAGLYDNDPAILQLLAQFHISLKRTASGAIDTSAALQDLADVISKTGDPHTQRRIADQFGIAELLPMLRDGSAGMRAYTEEVHKLGMVIDEDGIRKANEFEKSLWRLEGALKGASNAWGARFGPGIASGMDAATNLLAGKPGNRTNAVLDAISGVPGPLGGIGGAVRFLFPIKAPKTPSLSPTSGTSPVSYRDPAYDDLDATVESQMQLPKGMLSSIRLNGERSNADQVSSAGARTAYQITPQTRALAMKRWGIDAYEDADSASRVAGLLLKDSMDRNHGDSASAVREYVGGTNPANWGPTTNAYVGRVMGGMQAGGGAAAAPAKAEVSVTFKNAPPGMTAEARSGGAYLPTLIHYAMPDSYMP